VSQAPIWFDRKFEFSFPAELFPNICVRLRGTPARIEEMLNRCAHEVLIAKPQGKWSPQEQAGARDQLTAADLTNRGTDEANHNSHPLSRILTGFRAAREKLLRTVNELDPSLYARTIPHPRLKIPMRLVDHLYFVAEHDDHHLACIWELVKAAT